MPAALHLNLDDAWPAGAGDLPVIDLQAWGPRLRFTAPPRMVESFYREIESQLAAFTLSGSGDFHHLSALWLRRLLEPVVLVSFDNHPDWDVRPPRWACGGWVNRALELTQVRKVSVWGCGGFETWWPGNIFANRSAQRAGRLEVYRWVDGRSSAQQNAARAIRRADWRARFQEFVRGLEGATVYITIDLDCLASGEAVTNWENGNFTAADVAWALGLLQSETRVVGGDLCGAFSAPQFARRKQRFASEWDHPKLPQIDLEGARRINLRALQQLWPGLTGTNLLAS